MVKENTVKRVLDDILDVMHEPGKEGIQIQDFLVSLGFEIQYDEYEAQEYITIEDAIAFIKDFLMD